MTSEKAAIKVKDQIDKTVEQGGKIALGGERNGAFITPTVITGVPKDADVAIDMEIFGPVVPIIEFETVEEAIEIALKDAGISASDIDAVYGFGNGCAEIDNVEKNVYGKFFDEKIGLKYYVWPQAQRNPDGPSNRVVLNVDNIHIVRIDKIELTPNDFQLVQGSETEIPLGSF